MIANIPKSPLGNFDEFGLEPKPKFVIPASGSVPGAEGVVIAPPPSESDLEQALRLNGVDPDFWKTHSSLTSASTSSVDPQTLTLESMKAALTKAQNLSQDLRDKMNQALGRKDGEWTVIDADGHYFHGTAHQLVIHIASEAVKFKLNFPFPNESPSGDTDE